MQFDAEGAEVYDKQFAAMQPIKEAVHLLIEIQFADLPADARVLMACAGTGAEARYLAARFPGWRFTPVDPSAPMLNVARRHAEAEGFGERCTFLADYVSGAPMDAHDAATSLHVSHFLTETGARQAFFAGIAARLKPGGAALQSGPMRRPASGHLPGSAGPVAGPHAPDRRAAGDARGLGEQIRARIRRTRTIGAGGVDRSGRIYPACPGVPGRDDAGMDGCADLIRRRDSRRSGADRHNPVT